MEEFIQFSAKTKNEAITKACIELGVSSDQLEMKWFLKVVPDFLASEANRQSLKHARSIQFLKRMRVKEIVDNWLKWIAIRKSRNRKPPTIL